MLLGPAVGLSNRSFYISLSMGRMLDLYSPGLQQHINLIWPFAGKLSDFAAIDCSLHSIGLVIAFGFLPIRICAAW
jgi:hypothetical protein